MATRQAGPSRNLGRLTEITQVAARYGFGYVLRRNRRGDLIEGADGDEATASDRGRRLREMLDELGPTFVKFGQLLSTRPDVIPPDIVVELRGLQDAVTPFPYEQVREVVEAELGLTVEQAFVEFDEIPIASASIGQVHRAVLPDGREVALKVQRPAAARQIEADLGLLYQAAKLLRERVRALEFMDPRELVDEFARSIRLELDYGHEARNAATFRRNFAREPEVVVPDVIRRYSTGRVLALEFLHGTKVSELDLAALSAEQRRDIAYRMADAWMTMVFRHGFFHSDPHPGNIFVLDSGELGLVDFGQAGKLSDEDMTRLTRLFLDCGDRERRRDPAPPAGPRCPVRTRAGGGVPRRDPRPLRPLLRHAAVGHRPAAGDPGRVPAHLLDESAAAVALRDAGQGDRHARVRRRGGLPGLQRLRGREAVRARAPRRPLPASRMAQRTWAEAVAIGEIARELPYQAHDVLERMRDGTFQIRLENPGLDELDDHIDRASNRLSVALIVLGGLVGSSIVGVFAEDGPQVIGLHLLSFVGFVVSGAFGLWLIWGVMRHGRL